MPDLDMRPVRLLYIENDPALRNILGKMLSASSDIDFLGSYSGADEVLDRALIRRADVALIDFALDQNGLNGIELGIALRNINEYIGIVIYSQYSVRPMVNRVPKSMRAGWSFFNKSADMEGTGKRSWPKTVRARRQKSLFSSRSLHDKDQSCL
jgi:DNA-binding NarL/FixJ family response regulator